jgi:hypothetical protein
MRQISFSYNWNKKLDCDAFTTIRLYQPEKYCIGEQYEIQLKKEKLFEGVIVDVKKFMLKDLSNFVAYLDTGYSKENCQSIIQKMYSKVDFTTQPLSLILIHKIK